MSCIRVTELISIQLQMKLWPLTLELMLPLLTTLPPHVFKEHSGKHSILSWCEIVNKKWPLSIHETSWVSLISQSVLFPSLFTAAECCLNWDFLHLTSTSTPFLGCWASWTMMSAERPNFLTHYSPLQKPAGCKPRSWSFFQIFLRS